MHNEHKKNTHTHFAIQNFQMMVGNEHKIEWFQCFLYKRTVMRWESIWSGAFNASNGLLLLLVFLTLVAKLLFCILKPYDRSSWTIGSFMIHYFYCQLMLFIWMVWRISSFVSILNIFTIGKISMIEIFFWLRTRFQLGAPHVTDPVVDTSWHFIIKLTKIRPTIDTFGENNIRIHSISDLHRYSIEHRHPLHVQHKKLATMLCKVKY